MSDSQPPYNDSEQYVVNRPCYNVEDFRKGYRGSPPSPPTVGQKVKNYVTKSCTPKELKKSFFGYFAIFKWLPRYRISEYLLADIVAGITIFVVQLPQGIAYGRIAGLSPMQGIYASCFPLLSYFIMSKSKYLSVGPTMTTSVLLGAIILKHIDTSELTATDYSVTENSTITGGQKHSPTPVELSVIITFVAGLYQILLGILHLDFLFVYLSKPFVGGYILGNVVKLTIQEASTIFGVKTGSHSGAFDTIYFLKDFFEHITTINWVTSVISILSLIVLFAAREYLSPYIQKKFKIPLPIELFVVVAGTVASAYLHLESQWNVETVGVLQTGIPAPTLPPVDLIPTFPSEGFMIAIISLCFSLTLNNLFAAKYNEHIENDKEFVALGVSNIVSSLFSGMPIGGAISRSLIQESVGGKTQVVGIVTFIFFILSLLVLGEVLTHLPECILSAIIIISFKDCLKSITDLCKLWKHCKLDAMVWLVALCATVLVNLTSGLWIGLAFNVLVILYRTQRPNSHVLGIVPKTNIYVPLEEYEASEEIAQVKIFRFDGALICNSIEHFSVDLSARTGIDVCAIASRRKKEAAKKEKLPPNDGSEPQSAVNYGACSPRTAFESEDHIPKYVIIDCSVIGSVDTTGLNQLLSIYTSYQGVQIELILANCNDYMYDMMERTNFFNKFPISNIFISVHDAVLCLTKK